MESDSNKEKKPETIPEQKENEITKDDCKFENEKEIKENCEIKINDKIIPFNYFHKFKKKGKYKIE